MAKWREKVLCFNCDQKFSQNHRCKAKFMLIMAEHDESIDEDFVRVAALDLF
ncbi:Retrovirus-related Pol polyprotein from transposon 297 family [Sesbania bispinosa]|nr:Retrovirus-related Pol polyprotein from transposon 297 family [Sesbania bispinosa]